jgi:hypothetical protein
MTRGRVQWRALVDMVVKVLVSLKAGTERRAEMSYGNALIPFEICYAY